MFEGHQFIKVCGDTWVFDFTDYVGYKVTLCEDKQTVKKFEVAFKVYTNTGCEGQLVFDRYIAVPVRILKETVKLIKNREVLFNAK